MIRTFSLDIDDLVCIMTQPVNEATEPGVPKQTHETEYSSLLNASGGEQHTAQQIEEVRAVKTAAK